MVNKNGLTTFRVNANMENNSCRINVKNVEHKKCQQFASIFTLVNNVSKYTDGL